MRSRSTAFLALVLSLAGCASNPSAFDEAAAETGFGVNLNNDDGQAPFEEQAIDGKGDIAGERGPAVSPGRASEVWAVTRDWADVDSEAGVAWGENSGLNWEEKFDAWVASMEPVDRTSGWGQTFRLPTPYGDRVLDGPTLECAEVALLFRVTFASWYNLPFFIQGWDSNGRQSLFAGHFGIINRSGQIIGRFPSFRTAYQDYTGRWSPGQEWPSDSRLRRYRLGDDDAVPSLSENGEVGAGAYFDEMFLNKRVGYFARLLLLYFGSVNLVDEANMFHIAAEATRAGDVLVKRWQRRGIGHVIPVMRHAAPAPGRLELWVASGSMPRRQPQWEEPASARNSFTNNHTGGTGENSDGDAYAALGGGIRRWRTAVVRGGRWRNVVREADQGVYISDTDHDRLSQRPGEFEGILADVPLSEQLDVAVEQVNAARRHLRNYPASCAARTRREDAFERLYQLSAELNGFGRAQTDAEYRRLEDYAFGELEYDTSRTCCWNRSTGAMAEMILAYAEQEQMDAEAGGMCMAPTVFRAETDGYARWANYAASIGRGGEWAAWSEDETCSQRDVPEDSFAARQVTAFCDVGGVDPEPEPEEPMPEPDACDGLGQDDSFETAINFGSVAVAGSVHAEICGGDKDYYLVEGGGEVTISFTHADGDLDLEALSLEGNRIGSSTSTSDSETVSSDTSFVVRVYGYSGATGAYTISLN